jgi:septal ring factor EnvC (AmiA/AmiB activator)
LSLALLLCAALLSAQETPGPPQDLTQVKGRLTQIQAALTAVDQQIAALAKRRKGVLVELQAISLQADRVRAQAEQARLKRDQAQLEVQTITRRKDEITREIFLRRSELRKEVRWMQALGPLGDLGLFSSFASFEQFIVQGRYLAYLRNQERVRLDRIQRLQADLAKREAEIQEAMVRLTHDEAEAVRFQATLQLNEGRLETFLDGLKQDESRRKRPCSWSACSRSCWAGPGRTASRAPSSSPTSGANCPSRPRARWPSPSASTCIPNSTQRPCRAAC